MTLWKSYYLARNLQDALKALSDSNGNVRLIAGGTDLLIDPQQGRCPPLDTLVDITQVPELCSLEIRQESLFIGAAVSLNRLICSELVQEHATALWQACPLIGGPQVRNMATLGGNVSHALPAGDGSIALLALDATAEVASTGGSRRVPIAELYLGPGKTSLAIGKEILVGFYLPLRQPGEGSAFRRVMRPQGVALLIVNMAVWLCSQGNVLQDVRIATGLAGTVPYRAVEAEQALKGKTLCDASLQGKHVLTIEGLLNGLADTHQQGLHPFQEAFILYGAVQCGFCIPGQIMMACALLRSNPNPTRDEIRQALKNTLCRCGGYPSIEKAILVAAEAVRNGNPVKPPTDIPEAGEYKVIGKTHPRPDAVDKVTGSAVFTDDPHFEGMLHARVKRAGLPHAVLTRVNVTRARQLPGVVAVLTAEDLPAERNHGLVIPDWPILVGVGERVRYPGDAIALVAAVSRQVASQALGLIDLELEPQTVVSTPKQALQPDAPQLHPNGNLLKHIKVRNGNTEIGFAEAEVIPEHTFHTISNEHAFLETECGVARPTEDGRMEIYVGSQIPHADREQVAHALGWPEERVRIIGQNMGGGFGGKEDIAEQIHAALLAYATGKPVKLLFDRHESMPVHPKRHAAHIHIKVGARRDGRLTAMETELWGDTGAYASLGEKVLTRATTHSTGPYEIPHVRADCHAAYTNNPPTGAFRGFGATQSAFAVESMMDILAHELGIDPIQLRWMNALRGGSMTNTGQLLKESVGLLECLDRVEEELSRRCK